MIKLKTIDTPKTVKLFGPLEVPNKCRVEYAPVGEQYSISVFIKNKEGQEYLLVKEDYESASQCERKWFNSKRNVHRNEKYGPALFCVNNGSIPMWEYFRNGKRHRLNGPAFHNACNIDDFFLNGKEITAKLHKKCVEENKGRLPKPPKVGIDFLCGRAAGESVQARKLKSINGDLIEEDELDQIDLACNPKNWENHGCDGEIFELLPNGNFEACLNCEPLDDTLRCYIIVDPTGLIVQANLSVE